MLVETPSKRGQQMSCEGNLQSMKDSGQIEDVCVKTKGSETSFKVNVNYKCADSCQDIQCNNKCVSSPFISGENVKLTAIESPIRLNAEFQSVELLVQDTSNCNSEDWLNTNLSNDNDYALKGENTETGCGSDSPSQNPTITDVSLKKCVVKSSPDGILSFDLLPDLHEDSGTVISCQNGDDRAITLCDYDANPDLDENELKLSNGKKRKHFDTHGVHMATLALSDTASECSEELILKEKSENKNVQYNIIHELSDYESDLRDKLESRDTTTSKKFETEFEIRDVEDLNEFNMFSFPVDSVFKIQTTDNDNLNGSSDHDEDGTIVFEGEAECTTAATDHDSFETSQIMLLCPPISNKDDSDGRYIESGFHVAGKQKGQLIGVESNQEAEEEPHNKTTCPDDTKPGDKVVEQALAEVGILPEDLLPISSDSDQKQWRCPVKTCSRKFPRLSMLRTHLLYHYGIRPFKCDHDGCEWSFYSYFRLKRHKETHLKKKDFLCPEDNCGRRFTTVYNLNTHIKLHQRPAEMVCPVESCGAAFQTKRSMEVHLRTHDSLYAPYKCPFEGCGKLYYSKNCLHSHTHVHLHKEEELVCQWEGCGKVFDKPCRLKAHMRTHTGVKPYKCTFEDCGWAFSSASKLKRHQYKHTNERRYHCTVEGCGKSFMRSEHLKEHTLTHISERTFQCPVENCGQKFSAKSSLYVHSKKHNISKDNQQTKITYCCPIEQCNRSYSVKSNLRQHMLKFHTPVLAQDTTQLDYITLLTTNDETGSLEGIELLAEDGELASTDFGAGTRETFTHILLPSAETEVTKPVIGGTQEGLRSGIIPETCFIVSAGNLPMPLTEETVVTSEVTEDRLCNGSARTDLTYKDFCIWKKQNVVTGESLASNNSSSSPEQSVSNEA